MAAVAGESCSPASAPPPLGGDDEDQVEEMFGVDVGGDDDRW